MRIFIISDPAEIAAAAAVEQVLREYDYDVINPRVIQEYEKNRVELGMFDDDHGWLKRDIGLMMRADGVVTVAGMKLAFGARGDLMLVGSNSHRTALEKVAALLPWIEPIRTLDEWIELSAYNNGDNDED